MISDNAIPHCGLELGCCSRQIPYDLLAHDKNIMKEAINDFVNAYINDKYDCEHCDRDDEHCCIKCFRDRYLQRMDKRCKDCARFGDLHSSCEKVRLLQVDENTIACESFKS